MYLQRNFFIGLIIGVILIQSSVVSAEKIINVSEYNKEQNKDSSYFELSQVNDKQDGTNAPDGESQKSEGFWNWVGDVFDSNSSSQNDGEESSSWFDGESWNPFSLLKKKQSKTIVLLQGGEAATQDGESVSEDQGFIDWLVDVFSFGNDGESSSSSKDGEVFSLLQIKSKNDGEQETSSSEGFIDWVLDIFSFGGDGESTSFEQVDGELQKNLLQIQKKKSDGERSESSSEEGGFLDWISNIFSFGSDGESSSSSSEQVDLDGESQKNLLQIQNKQNDGESSESSSEEGGLLDWISNIFSFGGDGESSSSSDGEFLNSINPLNIVDGESLLSMIKINNKENSKKSQCTEPVSQKWGQEAWKSTWQGQWKFRGNTYGVEYNKEFLPLAKFDKQGNVYILFKNNNQCTAQLSDYLGAQTNDKMQSYNRRQLLQKAQNVLDGEIVTEVIPNVDFDGEFINSTDDSIFDFDWGMGMDDGEGWSFDFIPEFDGEWNFDIIPDFDGEFGFDWVPTLDGESNWIPFFDGESEIFDGEIQLLK